MFGFFKRKKEAPKSQTYITSCVYNCLKEKCPLWVVLQTHYTMPDGKGETKSEGKCAVAWIPNMLIDIRLEMSKHFKKE